MTCYKAVYLDPSQGETLQAVRVVYSAVEYAPGIESLMAISQ